MLLAFAPLLTTAQNAPIVSPPSAAPQATDDVKAAGELREQADSLARMKAKEADAAKRILDDKAAATSKAKAALAKQQKKIARQKADLEAQAVKNAERQAKAEIQANQAAAKAKQDADLQAKIDAEKKARAEAEKQAADAAKAAAQAAAQARQAAELKAKQAEMAKQIAADKAAATSAAKAALVKQRKDMEAQKADFEVQAVMNAERQAKSEIQARQADADKVAREARIKSRIDARTGQSATEAPVDLSSPIAMAKGATGKPVVTSAWDLQKEKWRVAVGAFCRRIGIQRFTTGSYSASYAIGRKSSRDNWVGPAGGLNDAGNRVYDDGYVKADDYTDLDSGTWNWGYDNGRQVKGSRVEFQGVDEVRRDYSRQTVALEAENRDNADYRGGLMVEVDRYLAQTPFVDYGVSFGLARAQTFQASASGVNNFNDNQEWATYNNRVVDAYDITGLGITPDSLPYHGNRTDKGPVIDASPMTRQGAGSELVSAGSYLAYNSISESLDMDLSTLSLGMSVKGNYRRVYLVGSTGPTLNMVEKDATYAETLYESSNGGSRQVLKYWNDSSSGTECMFGYYVQAEIGVRLYRELHLGVFGRYDWLESVSGNVGPSRYEVNPSGGSMGGTVGLDF